MKTIALLTLIVLTGGFYVSAQSARKYKSDEFMKNLRKMTDSQDLLSNFAIKTRLEKLLGKQNYESFLESFETVTPLKKSKSFLFASGCLIHACRQLESAIAVDLVNKTIHAGIYRRGEKTKFFNEKRRFSPAEIKHWANRLSK